MPVDTLTIERRSWLMSRVTGKNTKPELVVRRLLHALGYRFRLHAKDLPGRPDIVFRKRHKAIFIHGCFWHGHGGCRKAKVPATRSEFWIHKIETNKSRDTRKEDELRALGYDIMTIWECDLKDLATVSTRIISFLGPIRH
ncbi:very short patch repair endonuclease [Asticcacaulis sp. DW145]|uniref:very short patch repair endonuclease n=1 Tax=Asticcacaulis sp. DW145 TaxID=3095608 RepID=UPI0030D58FF5